ncbi:hypothetical protein ACVW04_007057 [Bradyrhizobium sp. LM2.3]
MRIIRSVVAGERNPDVLATYSNEPSQDYEELHSLAFRTMLNGWTGLVLPKHVVE